MALPTEPNELKELFKSIVARDIHREGIDDLMAWIETTSFMSSPASTKYHSAFESGLVAHSLTVLKNLYKVAAVYDPEHKYSKETLAVTALFHDLCKANCYGVEMRNKKDPDTGKWYQRETYVWDEQFCFGGHGSKSVYLLMKYIKLTDEEATAINCHMGFSDTTNTLAIGAAFEHSLLAWMLHVADEAATYVDGI